MTQFLPGNTPSTNSWHRDGGHIRLTYILDDLEGDGGGTAVVAGSHTDRLLNKEANLPLPQWFQDNPLSSPQDARELTAATASFDAWPDVSHLGEAELFGSSLGLTASGEPARVYSAFNGETVRKHVRWQPNRTWTACSCSASRASCTRCRTGLSVTKWHATSKPGRRISAASLP